MLGWMGCRGAGVGGYAGGGGVLGWVAEAGDQLQTHTLGPPLHSGLVDMKAADGG